MGIDALYDLEVGRYALRTFALNTITDNGEMFGSVAMGQGYWTDGTCTAKCVDGVVFAVRDIGHPAPYENCRCGIYGCLTLEHLVYQYPIEARHIIAVIAAEGTTYLGSRGLRTQHARVVAYWCPSWFVQAERQFEGAERYADLFGMAKHFGLEARMDKLPCSPDAYRAFSEHFLDQEQWPREFMRLFMPMGRPGE